jgi:16S rRNA (uracil1498-N3)-methyltransferase
MPQERRVFLPTPPHEGSPPRGAAMHPGTLVALDERESHHLMQVLRLKLGAPVTAVDPNSGRAFHSVIHSADGKVTLKIESEIASPSENCIQDSLLAPLLKGDHTDEVIEKATELGIHAITLFQADRSVVKIKAGDEAQKLQRWERISHAASKQCRRSRLPVLSFAASLSLALENSPQGYFACLRETAIPIAKVQAPRGPTTLVVGPEGDFSPEEELLLSNRGFIPVSLGTLVLRAETAAMVIATTALILWAERKRDEVP